jgi:threonine dehydrogenase-like Zn-dependent dehydrogenase
VLAAAKTGRVYTFGLNERATATFAPTILAYREISIHGVYIARGTFPRAIELLADNRLGFDRLITREYPLEDIGKAIDDLRSGTVAKGLIRP